MNKNRNYDKLCIGDLYKLDSKILKEPTNQRFYFFMINRRSDVNHVKLISMKELTDVAMLYLRELCSYTISKEFDHEYKYKSFLCRA